MSIVQRFLIALLTLAVSSGIARAGDLSTINVLGFSADGKTFAFEEYGVQDGSGFPYANRYYIDTAQDRFLPGTPIRVLSENENATVQSARNAAREKGERTIADAILDQNRGWLAGWNAITELSADPKRIEVNPRPVVPAYDPKLAFQLTEIPMPDTKACSGLAEAVGFRLVRLGAGGADKVIQEDKRVPASRGCTTGFRLAGVQTFYPRGGAPVFAVIIAVEKLGFEGPDYRYMAVTGLL